MAKESPELRFATLAHHINPELLRLAHARTRKDGASGIDGVTGEAYAADLDNNLQGLWTRLREGRYRAPAVRRVHIPKGDGRMRPLGIPTFEDKIVQRAAATLLGGIYEQDFLPCSFGFRPGRSAHDALKALREELMTMGGGWVLDADLRDFFGTVDHAKLRAILSQRVGDRSMMRLIGKWLQAGVMEEGRLSHPESGTPQGGVISPLLANVYLHEVLDLWFERDVKPRLRGKATLIRYADDFVMVFALREDADRVIAVLEKRLAKYGLQLHPEKTRLVDFRRPTSGRGHGTFDLLGFTHRWTLSRKGRPIVVQRTAAKRMSRALRALNDWCRRHRHLPLSDQQQALGRKLRGHCEYFGITGNSRQLASFRCALLRIWRKWLCRRSRAATKPWSWFAKICRIYPLPSAVAVHSLLRRPANP
jgi:group II intron reverse transcriptase/maturase